MPLAFLAAIALWQVPVVLAWWAESQRLIQQVTAGERDPMGFWIIPAVLISAPPAIAGFTIVLFIIATIGPLTTWPTSRARLLAACVALPGGLIIASSLILPEIRSVDAQLLALTEGHRDAVEVAEVMTKAGAPHDAFASTLLTRFQWVLAGYVVAPMAAFYRRPRP